MARFIIRREGNFYVAERRQGGSPFGNFERRGDVILPSRLVHFGQINIKRKTIEDVLSEALKEADSIGQLNRERNYVLWDKNLVECHGLHNEYWLFRTDVYCDL